MAKVYTSTLLARVDMPLFMALKNKLLSRQNYQTKGVLNTDINFEKIFTMD
jgi:hypothetical protein